MRKVKGGQRLLAALLCASLVFQHVSLTAFADETDMTVEQQTQEDTEESEETTEGIQEESRPEESTEPHAEITSETEPQESSEESISTKASETEVESTTQSDTATEDESSTQSETATQQESDSEGESMSESETESESSTESETETETRVEDWEVFYADTMSEYSLYMDELTASNETFKITEEQLCLQAPQYLLMDNGCNKYIDKCYDLTIEAMHEVDANQTGIAAFIYALENGKEFLMNEFAASMGWTEDTYDKKKKDLAGEIIHEYMGNREYLDYKVKSVSENFGDLYKIAKIDHTTEKAAYKEYLRDLKTNLTQSELDKIVDTTFEGQAEFLGYMGEAYDICELTTSIIMLNELEVSIIDDLIHALEGTSETDLYDGLCMIRNDITGNIGDYVLKNYLSEKMLNYVGDAFKDALKNASGVEISGVAKAVAKCTIKFGAWVYGKFNPSVNDILHTTILYNYAMTLDATVSRYQCDFAQKKLKEEDIRYFRAVYTAHLCTVKLMMEHAEKLTSNAHLKSCLKTWRESIGGAINYDAYINCCRRAATQDIDAGLLTITESGSTQKTPDGTVIDENYDSTESIRAKYTEIQKKYPPDAGKTWTGNYGGVIQCFGFARMVFNLLFGCDMPSAYKGSKRYEYSNTNNVIVVGQLEGSDVTVDNMKILLTKGKLGDVAQGYGSTYGQHTMILQEITDTGATFYQCNYQNNDCLIHTSTYTWAQLANRYGTGDSTSGNGFTLYRASNYSSIYGDGSDLFYDDSVNFVIDEDGVLTKYNGWQSHVEIPETVTAIGDDAFKNNTTMMTVNIPDSVTSIGNGAFSQCTSLTGVIIPDSVVTIGNNAFYKCTSLSSVQLSKGVKSIGYSAFEDCDRLREIEIPKSLEETTAKYNMDFDTSGIFKNCDNLKTITFEEGTTKIAQSLFANCSGLEEITIPNTVTVIERYAFCNCKHLSKINIPDSVTIIEDHVFKNDTAMETIDIPQSVTSIGSWAFEQCASLTGVIIPDSVVTIEEGAFYRCTSLSSVQLSKGVKSIGYSAFEDCDGLREIEIPKSLETTTAKYNMDFDTSGIFKNCDNLKTITFEEGTTKIAQSLFANCSSLEEITIPNTVTVIERYAFCSCKHLSKINIPDSVTIIEDHVFKNDTAMETIDIPQSVTSIGSWAFEQCTALTGVIIPDSVVTIGENAFYKCTSLSSVQLSKGVTSIGYSAFEDCDRLKAIEIPKSLETTTAKHNMDFDTSGIFKNCDNLKTVTFEEGTTKIAQSLFANCNGIEEITIPNTVKTIERYAFYNCSSLKKVALSTGLETINEYAFINDSALLEIEIPDSVAILGNYIFSGCTSLEKVKLPNKIVTIPEGMFKDCTSLSTIELPSTVENIRKYAFQNSGLTELTLPENVKAIENYAFNGCTKLTKVTLNDKLETIGNYAFQNCDSLTSITIPDSVTSIGQYAFEHCDVLKDVKLGTGLTKIPTYTFNLCQELEGIVIPYRVITIESNAFTNCTKLTEVTIPRGTTSISSSVFSYPGNLTIYGISGTYAETYAIGIGAKFVNQEIKATEVMLSETSLSLIKGATHKLVMSVTPENFTDEVVWKSNDINVLTVDNTGMITAKAVGMATVRVAVGDKTASCTVKVVQPVTSISLNKGSISLDAFEEYKLTATVYPDNAADPSIEWTSSNEAVATVTQEGKVVPVTKGTATIKVSAKDGSGKYANCSVIVVSDGQLCISPNELESEHNYANNVNKVWKYTHEGAKTLDVTFDGQTNVDDGFDFIYLYDGSGNQIKKATGTELADQTVRITGDTVKIKLVSDEAVTAWGFKVSKITTEGTEPEEPEKDITDGLYIAGLTDKTYTGSPIKQEIKVYYNKTLLQENKDYSVIYKNNKNAGTASITVKGKGNLTGSDTKYFQIRPRDISDTNVIIEDTVYNYDKRVHQKPPVVIYNGKSLKVGKDYEVTDYGQGDYKSVGTYTVKIRGIGNFDGSFDHAKVIIIDKSKNLSKAKVKAIPVQEYQNGAAVELSDDLIKVTMNKKELKKDSDYTVSYVNNVNPGKATLIIKGIGEYAGTKKISFTIRRTPVTIVQSMVVNRNSIETVEMVKGGAMPEPVLKVDGYTLIKDKDYKVTYRNNKKIGNKAVITVKGIGNFKGSINIPFTIVSKDIGSSSLTIRVPDVPYTGKANKYKSKPIICDCDGNALTLNKDYTIESYRDDQGKILDKKSNPENGTTITVTISGKGNYYGTTEISYKVRGMNFAAANIKLKAKPFTGHAVMIEDSDIISANIRQNKITVPLVLGKDFEIVAYKNNVKKGTASVTFRGIGDYAGEKTVKFRINSVSIK